MAEREPYDDPREWDDRRLLAALRREEPAAFAAFYDRFTPLLARRARLWGVPAAERDVVVCEVLGDVALALARHTATVPRSLAAYLVTSLHHRVGGRARTEERRRRLELATDPGAPSPSAVAPSSRDADAVSGLGQLLCSEYARHAADPTWTGDVVDPALARLAEHLAAAMSADDRQLLVWLANDVPLRTAAAWLDLSYAAAGKRAQRIRARLRTRAVRYAAALPEPERRAVEAFLRRAAAPASPASGASPDRAPRDAASGARPAEERER